METDNMMVTTEPPPCPPPGPPPGPPPSASVAELVQALDQATYMAKQLPFADGNPDHHRMILSSLLSAQISLSFFLSLQGYPSSGADNSVSSAGEIIMEDGAGDEEQDSKDSSMDRVEEKMRDSLYIQNKRPKRPLSPSTAAGVERRELEERDNLRIPADFDPRRSRRRNLDLVYQFHG